MIRPSEITPRNILNVPLGLAWILLAHPRLAPTWLLPVALASIALGIWMRLWSAACLVKNERLSVGGPYRYVRDPMYLGSMLIAIGVFAAGANYGMLVGFLIVFQIFVMPRKQRQEGERLLRRFGDDYAKYVVSVSSLVPRLKPYDGPNPTDFSFRRACVNNHEYGIWLMLVPVLGTLAFKYWFLHLVPWLKAPAWVPVWL